MGGISITGALVLFSVTWFLVFYIVLQVRARTQGDVGEVMPGTPAGAPATEDVGRSARIATVWAALIFAAEVAVIASGWFTIDDLNVFGLQAPGIGDNADGDAAP